jgi:hypothetical protein
MVYGSYFRALIHKKRESMRYYNVFITPREKEVVKKT